MGWIRGRYRHGLLQRAEIAGRPAGERKKLRAAVRHSLTERAAATSEERDDLADQWQLLGADPARVAPPAVEERDGEDIELSPDLWPAWVLFNDTWSQWRCIVGWEAVDWQGIDLPALESAMGMRCISRHKRAHLLWLIQEMQAEARSIRNNLSP